MEYFDSKVLESFMIPEDMIATEGFGSKVVSFIKTIFKSIGRFFKIIGNTFKNLIKKMKNINNNSWKSRNEFIDAVNDVVWNIAKGNIKRSKVISSCNSLGLSARSVLNSGITLSHHPTKTIIEDLNKKYDTMSTDFEKVTTAYKNLNNIFNLNTKISINEYNEIMEHIEKESNYWEDVSNEFDRVLKSLDNEKSSPDNINNEYFVPFQKVIINANSQISKLTKMITDMSNNILKLQVE